MSPVRYASYIFHLIDHHHCLTLQAFSPICLLVSFLFSWPLWISFGARFFPRSPSPALHLPLPPYTPELRRQLIGLECICVGTIMVVCGFFLLRLRSPRLPLHVRRYCATALTVATTLLVLFDSLRAQPWLLFHVAHMIAHLQPLNSDSQCSPAQGNAGDSVSPVSATKALVVVSSVVELLHHATACARVEALPAAVASFTRTGALEESLRQLVSRVGFVLLLCEVCCVVSLVVLLVERDGALRALRRRYLRFIPCSEDAPWLRLEPGSSVECACWFLACARIVVQLSASLLISRPLLWRWTSTWLWRVSLPILCLLCIGPLSKQRACLTERSLQFSFPADVEIGTDTCSPSALPQRESANPSSILLTPMVFCLVVLLSCFQIIPLGGFALPSGAFDEAATGDFVVSRKLLQTMPPVIKYDKVALYANSWRGASIRLDEWTHAELGVAAYFTPSGLTRIGASICSLYLSSELTAGSLATVERGGLGFVRCRGATSIRSCSTLIRNALSENDNR